MKKLLATILVLGTLGYVLSAGAEEDVIKKVKHGQINWTKKVIVVTGTGAPNLKADNVAVARIGAERAAKLDALRNLLETIKGVRIDSTKTIADEMEKDNTIRAKVEGIVRGFKVVDTKYFSDGGVDVVVELPLTGDLLKVFFPDRATKNDKKREKKANKKLKKLYTGLIVDARSVGFEPALSPTILAGEKKIYGIDVIDKDVFKKQGLVGYVADLELAKKDKRVGDHPLVVKAKSKKGTSDIVIDKKEVEDILSGKVDDSFLKEGRVLIVIK